ncbi:MAG: type II toxin-antitoxin system HicB family antitoxin [bacterium]|nr:type II toxin-antitoxin system HicB family antitoxin [bacterium]
MKKNHKQFQVIIERDEDGYFVASVPALPGCYAQAKTLSLLRERVEDAISLCLEVAQTNRAYREKIRRFAYEPTFIGVEMVKI